MTTTEEPNTKEAFLNDKITDPVPTESVQTESLPPRKRPMPKSRQILVATETVLKELNGVAAEDKTKPLPASMVSTIFFFAENFPPE